MKNKTILIVEDDGIVVLDIKKRLEKLGYSVEGTIGLAEQAIEMIQNRRPDLVLMDIVLKRDMDGIEISKAFRVHRATVSRNVNRYKKKARQVL